MKVSKGQLLTKCTKGKADGEEALLISTVEGEKMKKLSVFDERQSVYDEQETSLICTKFTTDFCKK